MARNWTLTLESVFADVRRITQDSRPDIGLRVGDGDMRNALNEALRVLCGLKPGLFSQRVSFTCAAGAEQSIEVERALGLLEVVGLSSFDAATMDDFLPGWRDDVAAVPDEWAPVPGDALKLYVYPPAVAGSKLTLRLAMVPAPLTESSAVIPVPEAYAPALVEYVVGRLDLADDEHVNSQRAAALLDRFTASVKLLPP